MTETPRELEAVLGRIEEMSALDVVDRTVLSPIADRLDDPEVVTVLSGTWWGHPLHPALTDVPIGAFTSAAVLDLLPGRWSRRPADLLVAVGLLTTVPTALAGLNDWRDTTGGTRRVGVAHAVGNLVASVLYTWSLWRRLRGRRVGAVLLGLLGYGTLTAGGFLGGHLAYRRGVGVDENTFAAPPRDWTRALAVAELPEGKPTHVTVDGYDVLLFRDAGRIHALADRCSHLGGPLHEGHVHEDEGVVSCPWHHSTFRLSDGTVVRGPASAPQHALETRIRDGHVEVRATR